MEPEITKAETAVLKRVGARLERMREAKEYSHKQAEELAGVSYAYIKRVEDGVQNPSLAVLHKLTTAYGTNLGRLFEPWLKSRSAEWTPEEAELHEKLDLMLKSEHLDIREGIRTNVEAVYLLMETKNAKKRKRQKKNT